MKTSLNLRISLSFFLLAALFVVSGVFIVFMLYQSKELSSHSNEVVEPSLQKLDRFQVLLLESKMYTTNWVFLRSSQSDKDALQRIHQSDYGKLKGELTELFSRWSISKDRDSLRLVFARFESLLATEKRIMASLQKFEDYDDPVLKLQAERTLEDTVIPATAVLTQNLLALSNSGRQLQAAEAAGQDRASKDVGIFLVVLAVVVMLGAVLLSRYLTRLIVQPIGQIRDIVNELSKGVTRRIDHRYGVMEIGEMVGAVNNLSDKLRYTAAFAQQIGKRNFSAPFEPLSCEDTLGKALVKMRDRLQAVDESLNEAQHIAKLGSWEWNLQTAAVFWSDEMYRIVGKDRSFVPSPRTIGDLVHPDDRNAADAHFEQCAMGGEGFSFECRISSNEGYKIVWVQGKAVLDEKGAVRKMYGIMKDVTESKKAEAALQLKNKELQQKNKELEQFAYVTSHDLQEPLRTISSFVERFQVQYQDKLDGLGQKYLQFISQGSDRMKTLIKDLLDYSRIGRKKELAPVDCNRLLRDVLADLDTAIREANVEISAEPLPVVHAYPTEMKQLFQNLVINAVKFRRSGVRPRVRIAAKHASRGWEFSVSDNGIGIAEEHSERIFVIFQRLHTRTEYEGSGIGLSLCKKIVELHGGRIWVSSAPGEGSTFHFTIPETTPHEKPVELHPAR